MKFQYMNMVELENNKTHPYKVNVFKLEIQNLRAVGTHIWPVYLQYIKRRDN